MEKGMVLNEEGHVLPWWQAKIIDKWVRRLGERGEWKRVKTTPSTTLQQTDSALKYLLVSIDKTEIFAYLCSKSRQNGETIRMP